MRLIDAETVVNLEMFDAEREEWYTKMMTIEECLDSYTDEGCPPTIEVMEYADKDEAFMKGYEKGHVEGYVSGRASVEVSEDAISREQFREQMYHRCFEVDNDENMQKWDSGNWIRYKLFEEELDKAPSVMPKPKEGE